MKSLTNVFMFVAGAAAATGAFMGLESLSKNKYQVKKHMNNAIDTMTSMK